MNESELRTKINVYRERTVQVRNYEPVKVSASISQGFENLMDEDEITRWMIEMEKVVELSLMRQELAERVTRNEKTNAPSTEPPSSPQPVTTPTPIPAMIPAQKNGVCNGFTVICPDCKKNIPEKTSKSGHKYHRCFECKLFVDAITGNVTRK